VGQQDQVAHRMAVICQLVEAGGSTRPSDAHRMAVICQLVEAGGATRTSGP